MSDNKSSAENDVLGAVFRAVWSELKAQQTTAVGAGDWGAALRVDGGMQTLQHIAERCGYAVTITPGKGDDSKQNGQKNSPSSKSGRKTKAKKNS